MLNTPMIYLTTRYINIELCENFHIGGYRMVGKIIKYMRLKSGYKQEEIAQQVKVKQSTLSGYETDFSKPNYETVAQIAEICDYEIVFIDKNSGEKITQDDLNRMEKKQQE